MDRNSNFDFKEFFIRWKEKEKDKNILIYDISYKILTIAKLLRIRFNKIDGFIKTHNRIRCLVLFGYGWFDKTYD